jgi:quinol monooxygenase YgiN
MAVIAITDIFGVAGRRAELLELLRRTEQHVRGLPGARGYAFAERLDTADQFVLVAEWDTHDSMDAYHRSDEFTRFQLDLDGLLARPSEMTIYSVTGAVRPVPSGPLDPRDAD